MRPRRGGWGAAVTVTNPTAYLIDALRVNGCRPKQGGNGWTALCPAHDDANPSLQISTGADGRALITCCAGCSAADILAPLSLRVSDLLVTGGNGAAPDTPKQVTKRSRLQPAVRATVQPPSWYWSL